MKIIRVFPTKTAMTPRDDYAFVGDPPMLRPSTDEVHVSCTFTWHMARAKRLAEAWGQYYPVKLGGPAFASQANGFNPGIYVKQGITFTSRGCNNQCPWCLVPKYEGKLREIEIQPGNIIQDNNLLQCNQSHIAKVFDMLYSQHHVCFCGGLDSRLLTDSIAEGLRSLRIYQLFFAADTKESIKPLEKAKQKLSGFSRDQLRCYVLLGFNGETISEAQERLASVWELGFMPFAQLFQPPEHYIQYSHEWRSLARTWARPAAMKAVATAQKGYIEQ